MWITGLDGAIGDLLNNRAWEVLSVVDADNFTIDADTTGLSFTSDEGEGETRTEAPDPDPTPPVVPPPAPDYEPPVVGGGGGSKWVVDQPIVDRQ